MADVSRHLGVPSYSRFVSSEDRRLAAERAADEAVAAGGAVSSLDCAQPWFAVCESEGTSNQVSSIIIDGFCLINNKGLGLLGFKLPDLNPAIYERCLKQLFTILSIRTAMQKLNALSGGP